MPIMFAPTRPVPATEERELCQAAQAGDAEAMDRLLSSQVRAVSGLARGQARREGDFDDLVQVGLMALRDVVLAFDTERPARLWTAALPVVRRRMAEERAFHASPTTVPSAMLARYHRARATTETIQEARAWAADEARGSQRMDPTTFDSIHQALAADGFETDAQVEERDAVSAVDDRTDAAALLAGLPERDRLLLEMSYGFHGEMTDGAIAEALGIHRTRVVHKRRALLARLQGAHLGA